MNGEKEGDGMNILTMKEGKRKRKGMKRRNKRRVCVDEYFLSRKKEGKRDEYTLQK